MIERAYALARADDVLSRHESEGRDPSDEPDTEEYSASGGVYGFPIIIIPEASLLKSAASFACFSLMSEVEKVRQMATKHPITKLTHRSIEAETQRKRINQNLLLSVYVKIEAHCCIRLRLLF